MIMKSLKKFKNKLKPEKRLPVVQEGEAIGNVNQVRLSIKPLKYFFNEPYPVNFDNTSCASYSFRGDRIRSRRSS
jgi:hypothetical protein